MIAIYLDSPTLLKQATEIRRPRESPERLVWRLIRAEHRREGATGSTLTQTQRDRIDTLRSEYTATHGDPLVLKGEDL